jgi:hypothetical protein
MKTTFFFKTWLPAKPDRTQTYVPKKPKSLLLGLAFQFFGYLSLAFGFGSVVVFQLEISKN